MRGRLTFSVLHRPVIVLPLPDITQVRPLVVLVRTPRPAMTVSIVMRPATVIRTVIRVVVTYVRRTLADLIPPARPCSAMLARGPPESA